MLSSEMTGKICPSVHRAIPTSAVHTRRKRMGFILEETTIRGIHDAFRAATLTSVSLTQRYLDRISAYDKKGPELNAFVTLNPNAVAEAKQLDDAFAKSGKFVGPLHGIPVAVKDQAETKGIETSFGSIALKGYVPDDD